MTVAHTFVYAPAYDMATCLAMFTNLSSTIIFISRVEMHFHERYKIYSEAVTGGRGEDIRVAKMRMFRLLSEELVSLTRVQFIISLVIFLLAMILLPKFGFGGLTLRIYPCLAAGYFILFLMYAEIIFLYYFNDLSGAVLTGVVFCLSVLVGSIVSTHFQDIWYGAGLTAGSFAGWTVAYLRLRWLERNLDEHIFCKGVLMKRRHAIEPSSKVYSRYTMQKEVNEE